MIRLNRIVVATGILLLFINTACIVAAPIDDTRNGYEQERKVDS